MKLPVFHFPAWLPHPTATTYSNFTCHADHAVVPDSSLPPSTTDASRIHSNQNITNEIDGASWFTRQLYRFDVCANYYRNCIIAELFSFASDLKLYSWHRFGYQADSQRATAKLLGILYFLIFGFDGCWVGGLRHPFWRHTWNPFTLVDSGAQFSSNSLQP